MGRFKAVLIVWSILLLPAAVMAAGSTVVITGIQAEIEMPPGWTQQETSGEEGVLLRAENDEGVKMSITCQSGEVSTGQWNLTLYEDSECESLGRSLAESLEKGGYDHVECELHKKEQANWLRLTWEKTSQDGVLLFGVQYYTAVNGQSITVAYTKEAAKMTEEEMAEMDQMIGSIRFSKIQEKPAQEDHSWTTRLIWVALLAAGGLFTYAVTRKRGKR